MYSQKVENVMDLQYNDTTTYGDLFAQQERELSRYHFEESDAKMIARHFDDFEAEGRRLAAAGLPLAAYDMVLKCSHNFNLLDARGAISVTERQDYMGRVRGLAKKVIGAYLKIKEPKEEAAA